MSPPEAARGRIRADPIGVLVFSMWSNYEYVSLLWTTFYGFIMCVVGIMAMAVGIFWMRNVVKIEV